MCNFIGCSIEILVGKGIVFGLDSDTVGVPAHLLLETTWDRLVNLTPFKTNEFTGGVTALISNALLVLNGTCRADLRKMVHMSLFIQALKSSAGCSFSL